MLQQCFGLLPRFLQYLFFLLFDTRQTFIVFRYLRLQFFLAQPDLLSLALPIPLVARYVLQLAVIVDMFFAY